MVSRPRSGKPSQRCIVTSMSSSDTLVWQRAALDDRVGTTSSDKPGGAVNGGDGAFAFLRLPSVWLCFSFFFFSTAALAAIQSFAGPALSQMYGLPPTTTAYVVTGYMLAGVAGMLIGGSLAARAVRLERLIGLCLSGSALLLVVVGSGWLPGTWAMAFASLAGFGTGLAGPSRDMLIRRASPPGATGRVYGTVYSGLDVGFALAAPMFGWLLDHGRPNSVFAVAAALLALGVLSAAMVATLTRARAPLAGGHAGAGAGAATVRR